jgi:hypothetical protein
LNDTGDWQSWIAYELECRQDDYEYWEPKWKKQTLKYSLGILDILAYTWTDFIRDEIQDARNLHTVYGLEY